MSRFAIAAAVLVAASIGGARVAAADDKADCEFLEFTSTTAPPKDATIDADLKPLEKKLKHPPFSAWNSFKLLTKLDKVLAKQKAEAVALKTGTASAILRDRTPQRVNLGLTLDGADGKRVVDTKPDMQVGDWLVIGTNANNDGHFLAIMCK
jgi:hypothetical protein